MEVQSTKGHSSSSGTSLLKKKSPRNSSLLNFVEHPYRSCFICFLLLFYVLFLLSLLPHCCLSFLGLSKPITQLTLDQNTIDHQCEYGKFYIYDMPKEFNTEILEKCEKMNNPALGDRCGVFVDNGFGRSASGIEQIIPSNLSNVWYRTDQFALEILFHNRLLNHKCRTLEADSAAAFYIPFYVGLDAERILWADVGPQEKDRLCVKMLSWVQENYPYMNKSKGLNHFIPIGRVSTEFRRTNDRGRHEGSKCILLPSMRNITRLIIERVVSDDFEVGVPYPTDFHPNTPLDVLSWQKYVLSRPRHKLMSYAGAARKWLDIRGTLARQCQSAGPNVCNIVDCSGSKCSKGTNAILESFLDSDFCLQPRGDTYTRRSTLDCMIAGSIPVLFWNESAYLQYPWFLPDDPKSYSVFIHHDEVLHNGTSVKDVLDKFTKEEVKRMREKVVETIPKIIYAKPNDGLGSVKDAVDVAVDGVLKRISQIQETS